MAISGTSTDYTGRTVDMYISGSLAPLSGVVQSVTYSFGSPSRYVAGVQKLIQRYLISLTNSGFVEKLAGVTNNNIQYCRNLFLDNNSNIITAFRAYQSSNLATPLDEQMNTVKLVSITPTASANSNGPVDTINFSLNLTTNAGTSVAFVLPLPL